MPNVNDGLELYDWPRDSVQTFDELLEGFGETTDAHTRAVLLAVRVRAARASGIAGWIPA